MSYLYKTVMVRATNNLTCPIVHAPSSCLLHVLLKAIMCTSCALTSSSRPFHHVLGLWHHIMWLVMWLHCHVPLHHSSRKKKSKRKRKVKLKNTRKENKNCLMSKVSHNTIHPTLNHHVLDMRSTCSVHTT